MHAFKQRLAFKMHEWVGGSIIYTFYTIFWRLRNLKFGMVAKGRVHKKKTKKGNFPWRKNEL